MRSARRREARVLDVGGHLFGVEYPVFGEAVPDEYLAAIDEIGPEISVGRPPRQGNCLAFCIDDADSIAVAGAYVAREADPETE